MAYQPLLAGIGAGLQQWGMMQMQNQADQRKTQASIDLKKYELAAEEAKRAFDAKNRPAQFQTIEDTGPNGETIKRTIRIAPNQETGLFEESQVGSAVVPRETPRIDPLSPEGRAATLEIERGKAALRPRVGSGDGSTAKASDFETIDTAEGLVRLNRITGEATPLMGSDGKQLRKASRSGGGGGLPTSALKLEQAEIDELNAAGNINSALDNVTKKLESGDLNLSMAGNLWNRGRNLVGLSNDDSQNLASFEATLEKLRNDTLRLNKGTQTEGDAQRAMNELMTNLNDEGVVKQRIAEIKALNDRAIAQRTENVNRIRSNYGVDPLELGGSVQTPETDAVNAGRQAAAASYGNAQAPQPHSSGPPFEEWIAAARASNPEASDAELKAYYAQKYGAR